MKPTIVPAELAGTAPATDSWLQRLGRRLFLGKLAGLEHGEVTVIDGAERQRFGKRSAAFDLHATIEILHPQTYADVAFGGSTGAGEAYIAATGAATISLRWCGSSSATGRAECASTAARRSRPHPSVACCTPSIATAPTAAARNIAAHYDLGNEFFELFLDETMMYSCAIFERPDATLDEAQIAKLDAHLPQARAQPDDHLVEIGTGWGGLAIHAAQNYGCRVTTTTISREQHDSREGAHRRSGPRGPHHAAVRGLSRSHRPVRQARLDRDDRGGRATATSTPTSRKCASLLKPNGAMLLQAITIQRPALRAARDSVDFIQRFIFPGSFIPSVTGDHRRGRPRDRHENLPSGRHRPALRHDASRTGARTSSRICRPCASSGYPDAFIRMWEFYLCYCEGGFLERALGDRAACC